MLNLQPPPTKTSEFAQIWRNWIYKLYESYSALHDSNSALSDSVDSISSSLVVDDWTEVTATGTGNSYDFQNSWVNYDSSTYRTAAFYKDPFGVVHIKGRIKTGASGTTVFTLPTGYRPNKIYAISILQYIAAADSFLRVGVDGTVVVTGTFVSTDASIECSFRP